MNTPTLSKFFTLFVLLTTFSIADAAPVEFDFTGTIIADLGGVLTNDFSLSGKYTVDDAAINLSSDPTSGVYLNFGPDFGFEAIVGGTTYALNGSTFVNVEHDSIDQYVPFATDGSLTLQLFLQANGGNVFSDVSQPLSSLNLAAFDIAQFRFIGQGIQFIGALDSLTCTGCGNTQTAVPEPTVLALIGLGMLGFA